VLKERLVTGIILALVALLIILFLPSTIFLILSLGMVLLMAWEWARLAGLNKKMMAGYLIVVWIALAVGINFWRLILALSSMFWLISPLLKKPYVHLMMGLVILVPFWIALNMYQQFDVMLLLYLILIVIVFDSSAYVVGTQWGSTPLLAHVSPKKTVEGVAGGAVLALCAAIILPFAIGPMGSFQTAHGFLMAAVAIVFSSAGDLFESLIKRHFEVKDSGSILPGHGGLLDRFDSLTAVLPTTFTLLLFWGQYYRA
jgi:phosphatidate cytidylyltransferase